MDLETSTRHFHIRWKGKEKLDWQCFSTRERAEAEALYLMRPDEEFTIEEVSEECPLGRKLGAT
jgi:hypothetical protein